MIYLIVVAVVILVLVIVVAAQPGHFTIARSAAIPAAPAMVFAQINNFHKWNAWSPWARMDPNTKTTFEGPEQGEGAVFHWTGNSKVGEGTMRLTESHPTQLIRIQLEFTKPFQATNQVEFRLQPEANGTMVTWSMSGRNTFMMKAFGLLMNCDKMIGAQYEQGLRNLAEVVAVNP